MRDDCITVALGLPEVRVVWEEESAEGITVEVEYRWESALCPRCGERSPKVHSVKLQRKRDRRLWDRPVILLLRKRRFRCVACGKVFTEPDPVCGRRRRSTGRFREYLGQEALDQPVRCVAHKERVGEPLVRRSITELAQRLLAAPEALPPARVLGLDEFSIRKGQVYDTAVVELEQRRVLGVVSGRRQHEAQVFLEQLPNPEGIAAVVMDMHEPFRQAVEQCLPQAKIVVDKFHVLAHVHRALDQVRTNLQAPEGRRGELFRARYLLLTAVQRLTPQQAHRLAELLDRYPALRRAWALKETFRAWYHAPTRSQAEADLARWKAEVARDGPPPFRRLFPMLQRWGQEILNYFDHPYTNGFLEGKNNRIKVIKRQAYGYRNAINFRQRILLTNHTHALPKAA